MVAVVAQRWEISADCAGAVVSEEAEKEEADEEKGTGRSRGLCNSFKIIKTILRELYLMAPVE